MNLAFDQKAGPEGLPGFDAKQKFKHANKEISWTRKPEWKNGQLYGTVFSGDNTVNYLHKVITVDSPRDLPISLGSDDGIEVFLNGKQILANNVGRGAAPDQEKLTLNLKKGENFLLLKIQRGRAVGLLFQGGFSGQAVAIHRNRVTVAKGIRFRGNFRQGKGKTQGPDLLEGQESQSF